MGMDVILVGPLPTPAVPLMIKTLKADICVMITASHNKYEYNGLKNKYMLLQEISRTLIKIYFNIVRNPNLIGVFLFKQK